MQDKLTSNSQIFSISLSSSLFIKCHPMISQFKKKFYRDPLYRNSIAIMLSQALSAFFGLLFWIVAARNMPSQDLGLASTAISAASLILALSKLGLDQGLVRYLPDSKNRKCLYSTIMTITSRLPSYSRQYFWQESISFPLPCHSCERGGFYLFFSYILQ